MDNLSRRNMLKYGATSLAGLTVLPAFSSTKNEVVNNELLLQETKMLGEMDKGSWEFFMQNLKDISDEELDWKIHDETNTIRWIVGHLSWYDEWASDAIEEKGMYLDDKQMPGSLQESSFSAMMDRFEANYQRYSTLVAALSPDEIIRPAKYIYNKSLDKRFDTDIRTILQVRTKHFAGHQYQVRLIRGTYSRAENTDKSKFDPW